MGPLVAATYLAKRSIQPARVSWRGADVGNDVGRLDANCETTPVGRTDARCSVECSNGKLAVAI